jgi:hypothetical protein
MGIKSSVEKKPAVPDVTVTNEKPRLISYQCGAANNWGERFRGMQVGREFVPNDMMATPLDEWLQKQTFLPGQADSGA